MIRVLVVDDQELFRESIALILGMDPGIEVVGLAESGNQAIALTRELLPDVILMDIRMPGIDGIECVRIIKACSPQIKIIILTTFDDNEYIYDALKSGVDGFLLKGISKKQLTSAVEAVYQNEVSVDPQIAGKVFSLLGRVVQALPSGAAEDERVRQLSKNEIKIIQKIGQGLSNKEITQNLHFTEGTVRNYISSILKKLDLRDRTQIAIFAIQSGLLLKNLEER